MKFKDQEQENLVVSQAWNLLYQRLENDGLLPCKSIKTGPNYLTVKIAVAAALVACVFLGWYLYKDAAIQEVHNEANAPVLAKMLEDGTVVYLSEQASLKVPAQFDKNKREVSLQGDAFFDIKSRNGCPFIIHTDIAKVEVTGTSFKIKSGAGGATFVLSVREGEVRVSKKNKPQTIIVQTGETVFYDSDRLQLKKNDTGFDNYFKRIHFKDENLVDVATIINLHSDSLQMKVDPAIENRITCTIDGNSSLVEIAELICLASDLQFSQQDTIIYISKQK